MTYGRLPGCHRDWIRDYPKLARRLMKRRSEREWRRDLLVVEPSPEETTNDG